MVSQGVAYKTRWLHCLTTNSGIFQFQRKVFRSKPGKAKHLLALWTWWARLSWNESI